MKKYAVIYDNGDQFEEVFNTENEALEYAEKKWNKYLTADEKKKCESFYVMLAEVDEDGCIGDGDYIKVYKLNGNFSKEENE